MRMSRRILPLAACLCLWPTLVGCATSGGAVAGDPGQSVSVASERAAAVPPVYALLGERESIGLTSSQIAALDSLAMWLASTNRPLIDELFDRGIRRDEDPMRRENDPPRVDRQGRPLLGEIGANNEAAELAIKGMLTDEQRATVCTVFSRSERERLNSVPRTTARLGVAPGFGAPDVANYSWPWCGETSEEGEEGARPDPDPVPTGG